MLRIPSPTGLARSIRGPRGQARSRQPPTILNEVPAPLPVPNALPERVAPSSLFPGGGACLSGHRRLVRGGGACLTLSLIPGADVLRLRSLVQGGGACLSGHRHRRLVRGGGACLTLSLIPGADVLRLRSLVRGLVTSRRRSAGTGAHGHGDEDGDGDGDGGITGSRGLGLAVVRSLAVGGPAGRVGAGPGGFAGWQPVASSSPGWPPQW